MNHMTDELLAVLARGVSRNALANFYADPKNQAEFEKWLEKRNTKKKEVEEEE